MSKMTPLVWIIVGVAVLLAAAGLLRLRASGAWPEVSGRVLHAEIKSVTVPRRAIEQSDQFQTEYLLVLEYEYTAAGERRVGRILLASGVNSFSERKNAEEMLARFPAGKTVPVHVNPANPNDACLISGAVVPLAGYLVLIGLLLAVTAAVVVGVLVVTGRIDVAAWIQSLSKRP